MTHDELATALGQYKAGLEAEIALLHQLGSVAGRQRRMTEARQLDRLAVESDERDGLMRQLITVEESLRPIRSALQLHQQKAVSLAGYNQVAELRSTAALLVQGILAIDRDSMKSLADAELARRAALASLERGETTLAAYRKVLTPADGSSLVDLRG